MPIQYLDLNIFSTDVIVCEPAFPVVDAEEVGFCERTVEQMSLLAFGWLNAHAIS